MNSIIHESVVELVEYSSGLPSRYTLRSVVFAARVFAIVTFV